MLKAEIISFSYTDQEVLSNLSFSLEKGEHLAILGESGCGKSTLLHLVYGLLHLEEGKIEWKGKPLLGPKYNLIPGEDFIKLVAQEFNVMPFISVFENVSTYLPRLDLGEDRDRVLELLKVVEMEEFAESMVKDLSGGQKQRVALAKALAKKPEILLLDEPFSHIDNFRKNKLRRRLFTYLKEHSITCITATHDAEEALAFSDKILILEEGRVYADGSPTDIYSNLDSAYLAGFFGEVTTLENPDNENSPIFLLPHQLRLASVETSLKAKVVNSFFKGSHYLIEAKLNSQSIFFNHSTLIPMDKIVNLERVNF